MIKNLNLISSFPQESVVLPDFSRFTQNEFWISQLDPDNEIIKHKEIMMQELEKSGMLPHYGFLFEEKGYNPYLRLRDQYYRELVDTTDEETILLKLKGFEKLTKEKKIES